MPRAATAEKPPPLSPLEQAEAHARQLGWVMLETDHGPVPVNPDAISHFDNMTGPALEVHFVSGKVLRLKPVEANWIQNVLGKIVLARNAGGK